MEYGRFYIGLWRVLHKPSNCFLVGSRLVGTTRKQVTEGFTEWLAEQNNEAKRCVTCGWTPWHAECDALAVNHDDYTDSMGKLRHTYTATAKPIKQSDYKIKRIGVSILDDHRNYGQMIGHVW